MSSKNKSTDEEKKYSIKELQTVWQKVGYQDVKIAEYSNSMMISGTFALLFDKLGKKELKLIRNFLDLWEEHHVKE